MRADERTYFACARTTGGGSAGSRCDATPPRRRWSEGFSAAGSSWSRRRRRRRRAGFGLGLRLLLGLGLLVGVGLLVGLSSSSSASASSSDSLFRLGVGFEDDLGSRLLGLDVGSVGSYLDDASASEACVAASRR